MTAETTENPENSTSPIPPYVRSDLVRGVYRWSIALTVGTTLALLAVGVSNATSFLLGGGVALMFFWTLERTLEWLYKSQRKRKRAGAILLSLGKYVLLGVLLYQFVRWNWLRLGYFSLGLCIVYFGVVVHLILRLFLRRQLPKQP